MRPIQPGELGILKCVFGVEAGRGYSIKHMLPVPLRPANGESDDLFRLRDDILIARPAYLSTIVETLRQSIVPIVALVRDENVMRCLGTGFFVSATGLLVTAAHVVTDPVARDYGGLRRVEDKGFSFDDLSLGVMMNVGPHAWQFRSIEWAQFLSDRATQPLPVRGYDLKLASDTAICQVKRSADEFFQPLSIIQSGIRGLGLAVGTSATAIGYGAMRDTPFGLERPGAVAGDFNFDLYVSTGIILEHMPDNAINRRALTPGPVFRASLKLPGGMSGSPIFDDEGIYVHGIASSGLQESDGVADYGIGSMLSASLHVPISRLEGRSLLELLRSGAHGMPKLSLADG